MATFKNLFLAAATLATALMAGLFYAYSCSVSPGLARLSDENFLAAMQAINRAIQNPVFFAAFFGTVVLLPAATFVHFKSPVPRRFWMLLAASVVYIVGTFGMTAFGNIPLNDALDRFNLGLATAEAMAAQRQLFESQWVFLNNIRSFSSILSLIFLVAACLTYDAKPVAKS